MMLAESYDDTRQRWILSNPVRKAQQIGIAPSFTLPFDKITTTSTIEGVNSTGDPGIGSSNLKLAITANPNDTERFHDSYHNRGGGQSPPTPTVGKTLLNTSANLLPITTASDTFNNLKNLLKFDKSSPTLESNRSKGGGNGNYSNSKGSPNSGEGRTNLNGGRSGTAGGVSGHFSTGYSKNSVKIRQHDSEVSPRLRRSFQSDSSSSRYYNKNSDILGSTQAGVGGNSNSNSGNNNCNPNNHTGRAGLIGSDRERPFNSQQQNESNGNVRRSGYQSQQPLSQGPIEGNYARNINSGSGGNYRQHQNPRYDNNGNGNGQQRQYGSSSNTGYNNHYNNNNSNRSFGQRSSATDGHVNHHHHNNNSNNNSNNYRSLQRGDNTTEEAYGNNYRDYEDTPRSGGGRYHNSNNSNTNSLERERNNNRLPPSALRRNNNNSDRERGYEREHRDRENTTFEQTQNRSYSNRTPPAVGGRGTEINNASVGGSSSSAPSSSVNSSSSSRGISPNNIFINQSLTVPAAPAAVTNSQQPTPAATPPPPAAGRWVPPSLRPQHALTQTEKNDAVFRKVRGILNKLTPEKFQELSDELLKLDLNSIVILNGVILLIFDKALDEPKYSSMYAQLCKRLSEEAPSFEKDPKSLCTFLRLLIAVCRNKFNDRLKRDTAEGDSQFNKVHRPQAAAENDADEDERRHLAKQRMLGNVKFIGELNKLDMLSNNVLHQCIIELLDKKKKRTATKEELCEDMECLAQLLKTCGKNLDSEQGKELMNQYFEKLERRSKSTDYPPRIRFMLKDVIELRENNWIPRKVATTEGPVPIKQIRSDDDGPLIRTPFANRNRDMRNNRDDRDNDNWMNRFHLNCGLNDVFSGLSVTGASPIIPPFTPPVNNNRPYNNQNRERGGQGNNQNNYNNRYNKQQGSGGPSVSGNNRDDRNQHREQSNSQYNNNNQMNNKELAPRFKRNLMSTNQDGVENLQMRPAPNSLLFKATSQNQKLPPLLPISTPPTTASGSNNNSANTNGNMNNSQNRDSQLSNSQYPLLSNPTTHLNTQQNARLISSTRYKEDQENKTSGAYQQNNSVIIDKMNAKTSTFQTQGNNGLSFQQISSNSYDVPEDTNNVENKKSHLSTSTNIQLVTKQGSTEKAAGATGSSKQQKKEKAFNKEEVLKKTAVFIKEKFFYFSETDKLSQNDQNSAGEKESAIEDKQFNELLQGFLDLKVHEKCMKDACINIVLDVLEKAEEQYLDRVLNFLVALRKQANFKPNLLLEVFRQVVNKINEREALNPRITTHVANLLGKATLGDPGLLKLGEIANYTDNGQHYPLFLLVLQQLHKTVGKEQLEEKFRASKIDLMSCLPEVDRNKTRLSEILDDRSLTFLYPLLKVQAEMGKQLTNDPTPSIFFKWIKANVDAKHYKEEGFISALMTVIVKYVTSMTSFPDGTDVKNYPDKITIEKEESLLHKYCQILKSFLGHSIELQLTAIYALQVFCYNENFPKGMLCRWFKYLYEAEVMDEETFIMWKEEISDKYPGKGAALFQVNNWLTWLQEAESEDDED
uniref:Eukaryotic translation initiation factor 4 gamma 2 n=1 Tax=Glossina pallidipes TaxID=7398 RepID=A0A1B0A9G7_GLOPL